MSYFSDQSSTTEGGQTDNQQQQSTPEDFVSMIVQEKGEQWKDPQAIAKGYLHAQKRIQELEASQADIAKQDYAKQLLETLRSQATAPSDVTTQVKGTDGKENTDTTFSPESMKSLIEQTLSQRDKEKIAEQNLNTVNKRLEELYGTEVTARIDNRAKELGYSKESLANLAKESPQAFFAVIGEQNQKQTNTTQTSTVNTSSFRTDSGERNNKHYSELRKKDKKQYYNPETQAQMLKDAQRLGSAFYN
jgi:SHS2 domain-containing protein